MSWWRYDPGGRADCYARCLESGWVCGVLASSLRFGEGWCIDSEIPGVEGTHVRFYDQLHIFLS